MVMKIEEIMEILPHRFPFLLVDRILELEPAVRIVGLKNVTFNEPFFQGHFPVKPIMPGVLILEAMGQVGGVLAYSCDPETVKGKLFYFMGADNVKFRKPVVPGDQLIIKAELTVRKKTVMKMQAFCYVNDKIVAEAELMAMIADPRGYK